MILSLHSVWAPDAASVVTQQPSSPAQLAPWTSPGVLLLPLFLTVVLLSCSRWLCHCGVRRRRPISPRPQLSPGLLLCRALPHSFAWHSIP